MIPSNEHETPVYEEPSPSNEPEKTPKSSTENTWGMLTHLTSLTIFLGIPFGHILGPLLIWLLKREEYPFVDIQGKESLNFQISMTIYAIIAGLLMILLIGFLLLPIILIADIIYVIIATIKTSKGEDFRYPFTIRLIK